MDPKPVRMTIVCGICHINTKKNHIYSITEALTQETVGIHQQSRLNVCLRIILVLL
jgi:hypothetical protein